MLFEDGKLLSNEFSIHGWNLKVNTLLFDMAKIQLSRTLSSVSPSMNECVAKPRHAEIENE